MNKKAIGIVGCGNIGSAIARAAARDMNHHVSGILLWDTARDRMGAVKKELPGVKTASGIADLVKRSDLVIEAVSPGVAKELLRAAVANGKDIMIMSIGGLLGEEKLLDEARAKGLTVILPSGAISGIDALKAAKLGGIESVTITTRKPPASLKGAPYLKEKGIDIEAVTGETVIYEGNAAEAVKLFPKNINVSALLSIAGIGAERTKVRILTSPAYTKNTHEVEIKGKAGSIFTRSENVPSPDNPKTSYLAVLAAVAALRQYFDSVKIGT